MHIGRGKTKQKKKKKKKNKKTVYVSGCDAMMQIVHLAKLFSMRDSVDPTGAVPTPSHGFSQDVEEEANSYFQKVYTSSQSVDEFIAIIKSFRVSINPREQEIFKCMIHNLFDEYRFFHKYPETELKVFLAVESISAPTLYSFYQLAHSVR